MCHTTCKMLHVADCGNYICNWKHNGVVSSQSNCMWHLCTISGFPGIAVESDLIKAQFCTYVSPKHTLMLQVMLTALQAQLELGDCDDVLEEYRTVASHCLPPRFVPNIPHEAVAMHHQSLRGMTSAEAKKAFLNLIQSWPLHRATIYDVMVREHIFLSPSPSHFRRFVGFSFHCASLFC
jgi:hypothetical protein